MLLTAREDKMDVMHKLNARTQHGLSPGFRIRCYLLKLINGNIYRDFRLLKTIEYVRQ